MSLSKRIEELTLELTNIKSIVGSKSELDSVNAVYKKFEEMDYYKENPDQLKFVDFENDPLERKSVVATMKGKKGNSNKTLVLIGHTDTVGISDYGNLQEYATKPFELAEKLKGVNLPEDAKKDLESGDWLFGRGIFDMKCGVATLMCIMEDISKDLENFEGNIVFGAVGDEEGNSGGMLSVVQDLVKIQEKEGFEYLAVLDTDYMTQLYPGDDNKYIFVGTVGKLMPSFYVVGKETHVGEAYKGLDPNQLAGAITNKLNLKFEFCDVAEGEVSLPPITLRQKDLKEEYSVQIAKTATLYFNYSTHKTTPDEVMVKLKKAANEAFTEVVDDLNDQYKQFCEASNFPHEELPWKPRVMSFKELYEAMKDEMGEELDTKIEEIKEELLKDKSLDERDFSMRVVQEVHKLWSDKDPVVVVYYSPPYYPHIYVEGSEPKDKLLLESVDEAVNSVESDYKIVSKKFYPYISDLSFVSAPKDPKIMEALKSNMPALDSKYKLPLDAMQKLGLPVVNIGPFGKDAHKFTERLEKKYSFEVAPELVKRTIENLLSK